MESQVTLEQYSPESRFFRQLIFEGNFDEAEIFITQFQYKLGQLFNQAIFELKKQKYLELIDTKPDVEVLVKILKEIESLVPGDKYKNLCFFLTLKNINEHPDYQDWSVQKGRMNCFESIRPILKVLGKSFQNLGQTYSTNLYDLIERLSLYELQLRDDLRINKNIQLESIVNSSNQILEEGQNQYQIEFIQNQASFISDEFSLQSNAQSQMILARQDKQTTDDFISHSMRVEKNHGQFGIAPITPPALALLTESSFGEQSMIQTELEVSRQRFINKQINTILSQKRRALKQGCSKAIKNT